MSVAELIQTRLSELGMKPRQLHGELKRKGLKISRQSVHAWYSGYGRPDPAHVLVLWEVLVVPLEEREAWMRALAKKAPVLAGSEAES